MLTLKSQMFPPVFMLHVSNIIKIQTLPISKILLVYFHRRRKSSVILHDSVFMDAVSSELSQVEFDKKESNFA